MSRALGRYELVRPLARGGMGEVYLARRRAAGVEKWLVVKRMRPERAGDARFLELFRREARLSMSLAHQNIVPVFDFGRIDDQVFLAMERVEGKDLGSTLAKAGKPLPTLLAAFIAAECCQALDYAHHRKGPDGTDLGIVHRDVTPRNVLLSWSGEVKLTDFGIAALAGDDPSHSKMAGTPAYMAPEQARAEPLDPRADVYAVGMVLREAITGERPRRGADREATIASAKLGTVDPWPDGVESPLKPIIDKATATAKEDRYPDARSMLDALDELIVNERAAKKGESPARLLAAWLAEVWEGERDEVAPTDAAIEAGPLMSFLDDPGLDVVGTGTQRSMLATAAEQTPPVGVKAIVDAPATKSTDAPQTTPATKASETATPPPATRGTNGKLVLGGLVAIVLVTVGIVVATQWPHHEASIEKVDPPVANVEPQTTEPPIETHVEAPVEAPVETSKQPAETPKQPTETRKQPSVKKTRPDKQPDKQPVQVVVAPPPVEGPKHKVTIQTSPQWSSFTVDGGTTKYQTPETIELPTGPHTIHFTGNDYFPADKTITIDVADKDLMKAVKLDASP